MLNGIVTKRRRVNPTSVISQFIIYVANSDIHDVPVMDIDEYLGATLEGSKSTFYCYVQLGFNEADKFKSSSILICFNIGKSIYT